MIRMDLLRHFVLKIHIRTWTSIENKLSCSSDVAYAKAEDVHTGVTTYYDIGDTANVYELQTFLSDQVVEYNFSKHNITKDFPNYNKENIKYCFVPGTSDKITAYAVALNYNPKQEMRLYWLHHRNKVLDIFIDGKFVCVFMKDKIVSSFS
jgi:hypothetical protein